MSLRVGLGASKADLDVQGEIDFDFFEESDCSSSINKTPPVQDISHAQPSMEVKSECAGNLTPNCDARLKDRDLNITNAPESCCSSQYFNKPLITVSCDDATGLVQKTTIETVIPTPFNYKDNKCGKDSPNAFRKNKTMLSPRLKSKIFSDDYEISDDSSISSMSDSESDFSSASDDSFELNDESDSMTDVSPLQSPYPCSSPMPGGPSLQGEKKLDNKDPKKEGVKFPDNVEKKECPKCEAIDINELLKAVKRLEMGQNINSVHQEKCSSQSVITQNAKCRKNLSFSNEEVRRIDNDNQVLLKKIVAQQKRSKPRSGSGVRVLSSSAVNRQKNQRQIELDNLALLKRLETTKASRDLSRLHLLQDYDHRSSGILSRASSRSSKPGSSQSSSCCRSNNSSGRSSAISVKSSNSSIAHSVSSFK